MKIKYNNQIVRTCDKRFSKKLWLEGSDPRINTVKPRRRACGAKQSVSQAVSAIKRLGAIAFCLYLIAFLCWNYAPKETKQVTDQVVEQVSEQVEAQEIAPAPEPTIWERHFGDQAKIMKAICTAESGLDPNAIHKNKNGSWDYGSCQINTVHSAKFAGQNIFDPEVNLATAKKILDDSGLTAWTCYKNKSYLKFMENQND